MTNRRIGPIAVNLALFLVPALLAGDAPRRDGGTAAPPTHRCRFETKDQPAIPFFMNGRHNMLPPALPENSSGEVSAAEDPGGNWGAEVGGYQLSLKLSTNVYSLGQAIPAFTILRNTGPAPLQYYPYQNVHTIFNNFQCWDNGGHELAAPRKQSPLVRMQSVTIEPKTQHRTWVRLERVFDLKAPGRYRVQAVAVVPDATGKGSTNVYSGAVEFTVVEPPIEP